MNTVQAQSSSLVSKGLGRTLGRFEKKVYLTDMITDRTYSGILNFHIESSNGDLHISMADVSVYEYSSCTPLYDLSDLVLSRPKEMIFIEDAA